MDKSPNTGDETVEALYKAVIDYVEQREGTVAVIGGIQIQEWPGESEFKYRIAVLCTGKKPKFKTGDEP